ncbi:MAG: amidohydrolase family protein [Lachnospiraceae bacterium]|nr:amidohydrolase family protein [Lachnospiraceae bacterium]
MKFDFSGEVYFDNHTHVLFTDKLSVTPDEVAYNYYHGLDFETDEEGEPLPSEVSLGHLRSQSVVMMLVHAMSEKFGCEPTVEAVTAARNARTTTKEKLAEYTADLFREEHVVGVMLDAPDPMDVPVGDCFPCKVYRLFRYENELFALLKSESTFADLAEKMIQRIRLAKAEGYAGLKGHIGERCGFAIREVSPEEAESAFAQAKAGEKEAFRTVYYGLFPYILETCAEVDIPLHLHTGTTGFVGDIAVHSLDPVLMAPFLAKPQFMKTKIILLHGSFPMNRNAAWMAYNFPNIYLDLSQTLLWQGFMAPRLLEEALSCCPHDKILLGTGQHDYCEMVWLASKIAKSALAETMEHLVDRGMISAEQACDSARKVLSENALRLYGA